MKRILTCAFSFVLLVSCAAAAAASSPVKNAVAFTGKFYLTNQVTQKPVLTGPVMPRYPDAMRRSGKPGEAEIAYIVNEKGATEEVQVAAATNESFGEAAKNSVKQWRFKPGKLDGVVVRVAVLQTITFDLHN